MNYKLGTSLNLLLTLNNLVGFGFTSSTITVALHKHVNTLDRPVFYKSWSSHLSNTQSLFQLNPTELAVPKDTYWMSIKVAKSPTQINIFTLKFTVGLFTDDSILDGNGNIILQCEDSTVNLVLEGAIINNTGLAAPPRVYNENLTPQITGFNNIFTTAFALISGSEEVKLNGVSQTLLDDYIVLNTTQFQMTTIPVPLDHLQISYNKL
jgi:hypothetical protein